MLAALASHLWIILLDLLLLGAAASLGLRLLPARRAITAFESLALSIALGLAGLSLVVFGLAAWHVLSTWWLAAFILLMWLTGLRLLRHLLSEVAAQWRALREQLGALDIGIIVVCGALLFYPFLGSLMPPLGWDSLVYHLYNPRVYIAHGGFVKIPFDFYSNLPMNFDLLFAGGMLLGSDRLPALLHFSTGLLALLAMLGFSSRYFSLRAGLGACLLLLVSPVVLQTMSTAYIDMGVAFGLLAAFICLWEWVAEPGPAWALAGGILSGFVIGAKLTATWYVIVGIGLAIGVARFRGLRLRTTLWSLAWMFLPIAVMLAPWMVKAYLMTGNPLYPLLVAKFGGGDLGPGLITDGLSWLHSIGRGRGLVPALFALWNLFFESRDGSEAGFLGMISPLPLLMFALAWIGRYRKATVNLIGAAALLLFYAWFFGDPQEDRFLLPALVPFCLLGGLAFEISGARLAKWIFSAMVMVFVAQTMVYMSPAFSRTGQLSAKYLAGSETAGQYLAARCRPYRAFGYVERHTGRSEPVALFFENLGYYLGRPNLSDDFFQASLMIELARSAGRPRALMRKLNGMGVEYVVVNHYNLAQIERVAGAAPGERAGLPGWYGGKHLAGIAIIKDFTSTCCQEEFSANEVAVYRMTAGPTCR